MLIKEIIFFTLPILAAGFLHHFFVIRFNLFSFLTKPVDFNLLVKQKRVFGDSKTFRGFIVMIILVGFFMFLLGKFISIPLKQSFFISGAILGLGYSLGELPNSFLKRILRIEEGSSPKNHLKLFFIFLDQTDSIFAVLLFMPIVYNPSFKLILSLFFVGTLLHIIVDMLLYHFSYKKKLLQNI